MSVKSANNSNAEETSEITASDRYRNDYLPPSGTIVLASTPIGDVRDASARLRSALEKVDLIAAEDTRRARGLASRLGVTLHARVIALHDHNEEDRSGIVLDAAESGQRVLMVSDAGMPTVSDPGFRLVRAAVERSIPITILPGPSAPLGALAVSGLPSDRFSFEGFLPRKEGEATRRLEELSHDTHTLIFFESPRRLHATLARMMSIFGDERAAVVCRELTKIHEEVLRGTLTELLEATAGEVRGEITIVVAGYEGMENPEDHVETVLSLAEEGMRLKEAAAQVARATGLRPNDLFKSALARRDSQR